MPIKLDPAAPSDRYLIFVNEMAQRRTITMITGQCSINECSNFVSNYPMHFVPPDKRHTIPRSKDYFQHEVSVLVKGICTGQQMPDWLEFMTDHFGGTMRFCDAYTFHVTKHFLFDYTGKRVWLRNVVDRMGSKMWACTHTSHWGRVVPKCINVGGSGAAGSSRLVIILAPKRYV